MFEFFGPGTEALSATGMATVCNMSAEIGSTSCIFPFTDSMARYLSATKRSGIAQLANSYKDVLFRPDEGAEKHYDDIIEIDLDALEPHTSTGPSHQISLIPFLR